MESKHTEAAPALRAERFCMTDDDGHYETKKSNISRGGWGATPPRKVEGIDGEGGGEAGAAPVTTEGSRGA